MFRFVNLFDLTKCSVMPPCKARVGKETKSVVIQIKIAILFKTFQLRFLINLIKSDQQRAPDYDSRHNSHLVVAAHPHLKVKVNFMLSVRWTCVSVIHRIKTLRPLTMYCTPRRKIKCNKCLCRRLMKTIKIDWNGCKLKNCPFVSVLQCRLGWRIVAAWIPSAPLSCLNQHNNKCVTM